MHTIASYCAAHGVKPLDWLAILHCTFDGKGGFLVDPEDGEDAAVIPVVDVGMGLVDYVSWPLTHPERFAINFGDAVMLGEGNLDSAASWALGGFLPVHRTPLRWLQAGGKGVVVLDHRAGYARLREAHGPLRAENEDHAEFLDKMLNPPRFRHPIVVPA